MRTVVFDLDGTLADTSGDLLDAANAVFRAGGHGDVLDHPRDAGTALRGGRAMLRLGYERLGMAPNEDRVMAGYPVLLEAYEGQLSTKTRLYEGAEAVLIRLARAGYKLAVCTNKPHHLAVPLLHELNVAPLFDAIVGTEPDKPIKPDPDPYIKAVGQAGGAVEQSLLIGDTATDRKTSTAAGVPSVLVTFSPAGKSVLELFPDETIDHFDDLDAVVEKLLG
ncbi:MAG: HAD hydrolase-like protein [Litoreibacter sp.]|nr:HAD hydrolase-like protein [Litoreibacter sp.]